MSETIEQPTGAADLAVVEAIFAAFASNDLAEVLKQFSHDVVVREAESLPQGGVYRGHDEFVRMLTRLGEAYEIESDAPRLALADDVVVVRMAPTFTSRTTSRSVRMPTVEIYTVHQGLVVAVEAFYQDTAAMVALDGRA